MKAPAEGGCHCLRVASALVAGVGFEPTTSRL